MRYIPEVPPSNLDPQLADYLNREHYRIAMSILTLFDMEVMYALPERVQPGMIRWFGPGADWPDQTDGGNQNDPAVDDGNGPGPAGSGNAGPYKYVSLTVGWQPI